MDKSFKCPKCKWHEYTEGEMRATGSLLTKIFNVQNRKFLTLSCDQCGYTEFYNKKGKNFTAENVIDFFVN